jgi:hypothetical protein
MSHVICVLLLATISMHSPVVELQIFAVLSFDAVITEAPSVENIAEFTRSCPASVEK